jgi:hypothetical protein
MKKMFWAVCLGTLLSTVPVQADKVSNKFLIVPGVSVGPVRLGMTRRQVKAVLGAPKYVYYGHKSYGGPPRESYTNYRLAFSSERATGRVIIIEVESPRFKTANGLSTQSQFKAILNRYPRMTIVRDDPFEIWEFSYNNRPKGIGFCFQCPRVFDDPAKDRSARPKSDQRPVTIGVYTRGANWKKFSSSE